MSRTVETSVMSGTAGFPPAETGDEPTAATATRGQLGAHALGRLPPDALDAAARDALAIPPQSYVATYDEYSIGPWALAPLWSDSTGDTSGASREHDEAAKPIAAAARLDGINDLVYAHFATDLLRTVRLVRASHGALIIPHVDYLEHGRGFTRMHVPLVTDPAQARSTEDSVCFHMGRGEVWFLDACRIHSGGVIGPSARLHLVLDFDRSTSPEDTIVAPLAPGPPPRLISRPRLPPDLLPSYEALARFIDVAGWQALVGLMARVHLRYDVPAGTLYDWLEGIADANSGPDRELLVADAHRMRRYFLSDGPAATMTFAASWDAMFAASGETSVSQARP
jgi:hypothetical protein